MHKRTRISHKRRFSYRSEFGTTVGCKPEDTGTWLMGNIKYKELHEKQIALLTGYAFIAKIAPAKEGRVRESEEDRVLEVLGFIPVGIVATDMI